MTGLASKSQLRMTFLRYALFCVPAVLLLGILSGQLAQSGYGNPWFDALQKPSFMPPGWMFGVAWTILYIMLGLVLALILYARGARWRSTAITVFVVQLLCNYAWSPLFFAYHQIGWAFLLLCVMIGLTILLILLCLRIRPLASLLLLPYLGWLCFAAMLNASIGALNPGADELAPAAASTNIRL